MSVMRYTVCSSQDWIPIRFNKKCGQQNGVRRVLSDVKQLLDKKDSCVHHTFKDYLNRISIELWKLVPLFKPEIKVSVAKNERDGVVMG